MTLYEAFLQASSRTPGQPAVIDLGTTLTFAQLRANVGRLSNFYQAEIPKGSNVALLSTNGWAFAQTLFAVSNSGSPIFLVQPSDTDESIVQDLRALRIDVLLVGGGSQVTRVAELMRKEKLPLTVIEIEKKRAGEYDTSFRALPDRPVKDTDPVLLVRLGDSAHHRKYTAFNHKQLLAAVTSMRRAYRLAPTDRMLTTINWAHPFALTHGLLLPLLNGAACVADPESPTVEEFVDYLAQQRVTRFAGAPKFYYQLLSYCAARKYALPGVKSITLGMGTLSLTLRRTFQLLKIPVVRCYGRPEAVWSLAMDDVEGALDIENTRSKPLQGVRMEVLTEDGEDIPGPGRRTGRLKVMTEALSSTYFAPEKGPNENFKGTWLRTDEIARLEGEGDELTVAVLGKVSDMLPSSGDYLSPRRIDAAAQGLDGVDDAVGFVRLDKEGKPHFAVAVVPKAAKINEKELLARIHEGLPDEYHPETLHIIDAVPRDIFESANRQVLQRQFSAV